MKMRSWLAVAVLMALPVYVWSQVVAQDGQRTDPGRRGTGQGMMIGGINSADTTFVIPRFNSDGSAVVKEVAPLTSQNLTFANVLTGASALAIGAADSNATLLDTRGMRLGMLLIKAWIGTAGTVDTTCVARLAFQVRTHLNNQDDSSSTFPIYQYGRSSLGTGAASEIPAAMDTVAMGHLFNATGLTAIHSSGAPINTWSGEFEVRISHMRASYGNSVDVNGNQYKYPNGIAIPLASLFGRDIYSPYTSVRVRVMTIQKGAASAPTATVNVQAHIVGTPL